MEIISLVGTQYIFVDIKIDFSRWRRLERLSSFTSSLEGRCRSGAAPGAGRGSDAWRQPEDRVGGAAFLWSTGHLIRGFPMSRVSACDDLRALAPARTVGWGDGSLPSAAPQWPWDKGQHVPDPLLLGSFARSEAFLLADS